MTTVIEIVPGASGYVVLGAFDTRNRYLRHGTAADRFPVCKDATFVWAVTGAFPQPSWRYSNGVTANKFTYSGSDISYDPAYTLVNI